MFVDLCEAEGLPAPVLNGWIEGFEVDAQWPGTKLIVELDSWGFHRTRGAFERDHARDLKLARYKVLRLTYRQLRDQAVEVARTLRALLGSARTRPALGPGALARASP
jgi:very-short-patch-repair endonuclease